MNHKVFEQKVVTRFNYLAKLQKNDRMIIRWAVVYMHFTATVRPASIVY